jgi:hypothetical protein
MPSPSLNRGVLILLAPNAKDANISSTNTYFVFQYNPEKLLHTINQATSQVASGNSTTEVAGPPVELFNLTFDLDSLDLDPPNQNQIADELGIHPALAMLESMMQPQTVNGQIIMPTAVFKWGANRLVAVRVVNISVEEKTFNQTLNPTRATVTLSLRALNASEVTNSVGARNTYTSHLKQRETLVDKYRTQTGQAFPGGAVSGASAASGSAALGSTTAGTNPLAQASGVAQTRIQTKTKQTNRTNKTQVSTKRNRA